MKPYLATRGIRAWDMMTRTCSVQVNLDYGDEPDLIKKFILGNRLAPVVAAIFANSPFADGAVSGFKSMRVAAWSETDDDRCGVSPLALQNEFSLADFVEYALDVPILLLRRNNLYIEHFAGKSFRKLLADGEIEPNITNFQNHLNKIFTEARLKNYLEFRAADCGNLEQALAISALWKGLLYDEKSLQSAIAIAPKLDAGEFRALQLCVAKNGLAANSGKTKVLELAKKIVELAHEGLKKNAPDEARFLDVLRKRVLIEEVSPADVLLENCQNSVEEVFEFAAI
jgi:glutamate--cysteine ligase